VSNSLFPCSVQIFYRTINAPHMMVVPLREWSPISGGHPAGTNLNWLDVQVDTDDMIVDFIALLLPFFATTCSFSSYVINTYASETAPARPQFSQALTGAVGTGGADIPAAQATYNFKTTNFGAFKLVLLDTQVSSTFQPLEALVSPANDNEIALRDYVIDTGFAFSGRDNFRPQLLKRITYTLNEKLRKSYHLD
jgi:hypothetical protein